MRNFLILVLLFSSMQGLAQKESYGVLAVRTVSEGSAASYKEYAQFEMFITYNPLESEIKILTEYDETVFLIIETKSLENKIVYTTKKEGDQDITTITYFEERHYFEIKLKDLILEYYLEKV